MRLAGLVPPSLLLDLLLLPVFLELSFRFRLPVPGSSRFRLRHFLFSWLRLPVGRFLLWMVRGLVPWELLPIFRFLAGSPRDPIRNGIFPVANRAIRDSLTMAASMVPEIVLEKVVL